MQILRQRLSQNTLALLFSNGGSAVLAFVLSVMIGRVLGEEALGIYVTVLAWIFPLSLVTEFGLGTLITRDIAQDRSNSHSYLRTSVIGRIVIGSSLLIILWIVAPYLSTNQTVVQGIRLSSPLIIILPFYSSFTAIFRAYQVMQPIAWLNLGMLLSQVILTLIVLSLRATILDLLAINVITSVGQLIFAWWIYKQDFYQSSKQSISLLALLKSAIPFAIAAILAAVYARVLLITLEQFSTLAIVGYYAAALRFVEAGRMLPHAFFDALFPLLANLAEKPSELNRFFRRVMVGLASFGVFFGFSVSIIASPLITLTYGVSFIEAIPILQLGAWTLLPMLLKSGMTLYWYARKHETFVNLVTLFTIIVQIGLAVWIIPRYGALGAVWVSIGVESLAFIALATKASRR